MGELFADGGVGFVFEDGLDERLQPVVAGGKNVLRNRHDDFAAGLFEEIVAGGAEAEAGGAISNHFCSL